MYVIPKLRKTNCFENVEIPKNRDLFKKVGERYAPIKEGDYQSHDVEDLQKPKPVVQSTMGAHEQAAAAIQEAAKTGFQQFVDNRKQQGKRTDNIVNPFDE